MFKRIWCIFKARNREFYRDKGGLSWNLIFPILLILGFAFAFSRGDRPAYTVGVYPSSAVRDTASHQFLTLKHIQFTPMKTLTKSIEKVRYHQIDMLVSLMDTTQYWLNNNSVKGYLVEKIMVHAMKEPLVRRNVEGKTVRYVDWLVPGILAMNMMFSALFGVGWIIVRYRKTGYLKRLKATPLQAIEFLAGQCLSRIVVMVISSGFVFAGTFFIVRFPINGSLLLLGLLFTLGCFCMISLGLVFAARFTNEELVSGLLNFLTWPMIFLSGVWFSLEGVHPWLQKAALALPLTHIISAMRAIMIDGAGLFDIGAQVLVLGGMSVVFMSLGSLLFKWE